MQLQLFPPAPDPPILFSFTLPVLPSTLPFPQAYAAQLQLLLYTEIEPPPSPYALDKAVWAVHLIEIVVLDMANRRVEVKMVDGAYMEWEMRGEEMLLNRVMDDVEASKKEAGREMREMERREQEEIAAAVAAAAYLPMTHPGSVSDIGHYEAKGSGGSKPMHRRSKSLFSSLLSALNLNSSTDPSPASSSSTEYRIGGRAQKDSYEPQLSVTAVDGEQFYYPAYAITALSTSEYTYPMRAQLARNNFPTSKVLRRRARSTLVDCFRRWIIPTVRERLQWGAFPPFDDMPDLDGNPNVDREGVKWRKMSKATNAYADWACRSMISRCERALRTAHALVEGVGSLAQTPPSEGGETAEKESRRSSASSTLTSAVSASSRASSSAEQVYSGQDTELDNGSPISPARQKLQAPTPTTASIKASKRTSASVRHVATLRTALDRFREIHESLSLEAIELADSHTMAMRLLEARGRRKAWSSSEGGGLCRSSPLGSPPITSGSIALSSGPRVNKLNTARAEQGYGSGNSLLELSIPLVRSTLGEISDTWEDWQMEWEMEKEFASEVGFDDEDDDEFPSIISDFDISADSISTGYKSKAGRRSDASTSYNEDPTECGHSGFSDSSSEDEMAGSDSDDISDRTPSPTSPSDLQACTSVDGKVGKARRGRRTGVKARMGKYEDVRDELPPDPPLMALSPPPRGKFATSRQAASGDAGIGSSPVYNEHDKTTGRPPRPARPSRLQVPLNDVIGSHHRREAASGAYPDFAQSRADDSEAGVFEEWNTVDDDDGVFGCPSSSKPGAKNHHITKPPINNSAELCQPLKAFQIFDGLGILEQVGGATEATRKPLGHGYTSIQHGVGIGIGYPPGLHGDLPSPPSSPTKRTITPPESPRRVSHYISRDLPPPTSNDASAATVPHAPPLVMEKEKETKRAGGRPRPRLTLAFPDPPSYNPAELPTGRGSGSSLPYTRPFEATDNLLSGVSHVGGGSTNQEAIVSSTEGGRGRTCPSKVVGNDSPALLLDTPTAEHPSTSSSYPYKWDANILPPGVKVIGTVGVLPASASKSSSSSSEVVVERSISPDTPAGCVASSSSSGVGSPFNAVAKVLSKVRKVKPVLYVTPPPPPSAEDTHAQELATQQPIRLVKLNRSKSWKELSVAGGINFRAEIMKRRRSADSVPTVLHSGMDTPASPVSQREQREEEGDRTVVLDDPPSLSPESAEADYSVSPISALSRTHSDLESGWATPSLVSSSSPSSATSSGFNSLNSTALDIAGDLLLSSSPLAERDSSAHSEAYDGIVMTPHAHYQSEPNVEYSIQEGWFPKLALEEEEAADEATVVDEPVTTSGSPAPAPVEVAATASPCLVTRSVSMGPRKLKRAHSATRPTADRTGTERPSLPPPPRPVKSIKRSLSLSTFGRKFESPAPVPPVNE